MQITDVNLKLLDKDNTIKAIASMTIENCFVVHNIKVLNVEDNVFVAMPSKKLADGSFKDLAHPINKEARAIVETAILNKYYDVLKEQEQQ